MKTFFGGWWGGGPQWQVPASKIKGMKKNFPI